jgi:putative FmdB family regulatory protein
MPTYHYQCKACTHEFEEFQSMSEDPLVKCPKCGKKKLVRLISGAGLVFKGSGFYLTDYKKQGSSHSDAPKETKPSSAGSETKPSTEGKKTPKGGDPGGSSGKA